MGRINWSDRRLVEDCQSIDISTSLFHESLDSGDKVSLSWNSGLKAEIQICRSFPESQIRHFVLSLKYFDIFRNKQVNNSQIIQVTTSPCNFGGYRHWFHCPMMVDGKPCGRRVRKLYRPLGSPYFGCRHCHDLTYRAQKEHNKRIDKFIKNPALLNKKLVNFDFSTLLRLLK